MSRFANLSTYSWNNSINGSPFEVKVFARNPEEARQEVFAILAEITRVKPLYEALDKELSCRFHKEQKTTTPPAANKTWAQVTGGASPAEKTTQELRDEQAALLKSIPGDFFNGSFRTWTLDYTADKPLGYYSGSNMTLGEFVQTTEPRYCGPVHAVSFRSCLDG
jgi:hypothetical protein